MKKFVDFALILVVFFVSLSCLNSSSAEELEDDVMGVVYMEGEFLDGDILKISILAEDMISPVLGVAFYLVYESEKLAFLKYEPGQFLERGGDPFYLVQNKEANEKVIFGATLRRDDSFPVGGDKIVDFYFQILEDVELNLAFENGVVSTLNPVRQDIDRILWENLILKRGEDRELVFSSNKDSVFDVRRGFDFSSIIPVFLIALAIASAFLLIFFLKKHEKKRPESYVNFK